MRESGDAAGVAIACVDAGGCWYCWCWGSAGTRAEAASEGSSAVAKVARRILTAAGERSNSCFLFWCGYRCD